MAGRADLEGLRRAMRAAEAALHQGIGTRAAWVEASVDYYLAQHPEMATWRPTGAEAGIPSIEEIRDRAAVADQANKAIPRDGRIDPDPERHDAWSAQLGWAEKTLGAVLTDGFFAAVAAPRKAIRAASATAEFLHPLHPDLSGHGGCISLDGVMSSDGGCCRSRLCAHPRACGPARLLFEGDAHTLTPGGVAFSRGVRRLSTHIRCRKARVGLEAFGRVPYISAVIGHDGYFEERVAATYDADAEMFEAEVVDTVVEFLAELAGGGRALELGIGTGRIALPLARRGVPVHGIDLSRAMVARLRAKPGGENIDVTIGDFARTRVDGSFAVAYLVYNTVMNLTTQPAQVACFRNVAAHLGPGGCFVVEVAVPELRRLPPGETFTAFHVSESRWGFDEYDVARQGQVSHHFEIVDGKVERLSVPFRYVWPAELDLMAQLAGMTLRERWGGWRREPFTSDSAKHVSVWVKPAG